MIIALFVLSFVMPLHAADDLGYLFSTPAQRAALDRIPMGKRGGVVEGSDTNDAAPAESASAAASVKLDGVVRSSTGKTSAWINGATPKENSKYKAGKIDSGNVELVGPSGKRVTLKPGQSFEPESGTVRDTYQNGATSGSGKCRSAKAADGEISIVCDGS